METQKIFKPEGKVVVIVDYREKEVASHLKKIGAVVNVQPLEVGDFLASEKVAIERKSYDDFVSSIIDGRIFDQAREMKENFERPPLLIEGYSNREINDNALKGAVASLLLDFDVSILTSKNEYDSAKLIYWIARKEQHESGNGIGIKVGKKPKTAKQLQEFIVASIPGVSTVLAKRLLEKFGSIENIFAAEETELKEVKGIGKKLARDIKKLFTTKY
jgi:Fanconi anemia group M protein